MAGPLSGGCTLAGGGGVQGGEGFGGGGPGGGGVSGGAGFRVASPRRYTLGMAPLVYLETSVVSYLTAWPSRDVIVAGGQQVTHEWGGGRRSSLGVVVSEVVHLECAEGDPAAAGRRADFLADLRSLEITPEAEMLAL